MSLGLIRLVFDGLSTNPRLALVKEVFEEVEGSVPEVTAIHAGLECGVFAQKLPGIDMVSFGPDIQGAMALLTECKRLFMFV